MRRWWGVPLIVVALTGAGCSSTGPAQVSTTSDGLVHIKVGVSPSTASIAVYLGREKYFADQGVAVDLSVIQSGADAVPRLLNGSLDIALGDAVGTLQSAANNVPLRVVGTVTVSPDDPAKDYSGIVTADASIKDVAGLSGRTVAVNQLNGGAQLTAKSAIDARGGDSSKVKFVELPFPQMAAAVEAKRVDAAMVVEPFLSAGTKEGLTTVIAPQAYSVAGFPSTIFISAAKYADANGDAIGKFMTAVSAAGKAANADPAKSRTVAATFTDLPAATLQGIKLPIYAENAADTAGMTKMLALANKYGVLTKQPDMNALLGGTK
ncbi:MAG TPA: ABC transporter substrate-binding protein [Kribbella sp.]|uniref:ABC transporter substrate-binding protein n=1 Tax=Kribbella sp. TaxID=1871183 RepID=UPI002D799D2C|nr:ABC transporter substrate-binding protein [Kribbella sp.]HET6297252.1 ABC transporter substrate-binding protein [Kribbella sp.]